MSEPATVRIANVDPVEMLPGVVRRTLATGDQMMIAHVTLDKDAVVPMHHHPHEQVGYVLGGQIQMTIDQVRQFYDAQFVDMSEIVEGGDPDAIVIGLVIQDVDAANNVLFQWHFCGRMMRR